MESAKRRFGGIANLKRIDPYRFDDVLELRSAEIADFEVEPRFHLSVGILGKTYGAGLSDALQSRGDIDAVTHRIAVTLLDDVA